MAKDTTASTSFKEIPEKNLIQNISMQLLVKIWCRLTKLQKRIFYTLHDLWMKYSSLYISQEKLAKVTKCSRKHVNETIKILWQNGVLFKRRRGRKTCLYDMPKAYKIDNIKSAIKSLKISGLGFNKIVDEVTLEVTQRYLPEVNIRTSTIVHPKVKIKEAFDLYTQWPEKDKVAFSRYTDEEIELSFEVFARKIESDQPPQNQVKYFQSLLNRARKGELHLAPPKPAPKPIHEFRHFDIRESDMGSFAKYTLSELVFARERFQWWERKGNKAVNVAAFLHSVIKKRKRQNA